MMMASTELTTVTAASVAITTLKVSINLSLLREFLQPLQILHGFGFGIAVTTNHVALIRESIPIRGHPTTDAELLEPCHYYPQIKTDLIACLSLQFFTLIRLLQNVLKHSATNSFPHPIIIPMMGE